MKEFTAFSLDTAVAELEGVVCVEAWDDRLFAGLSDGSLCVLSKVMEPGSPLATGQWRVLARRALGPRPLLQLVVAPARSMLLCLADDGVNAFSLPNLMLKGQAGRTRGASVFSWDDGAELLCAVVKRRLLIFRYDGLEFVEQREVSLAEAATSVQSVGGTAYVGLHTSFVTVDIASGVVSPLLASKPPIASLTRYGSDEVLVTSERQTVFMGERAKRMRRGRSIAWTHAPGFVIASPPYIMGVSPAGVEVRLLDPFTDVGLCQSVVAQGIVAAARHSTSEGIVLLSDDGRVVRLAPASAQVQAQEMLRLKEHEEALMLASLMPTSQESARRHLEDQIQLDYGRHLLRARKFEEAMLAFSMSRASTPADVLRSFSFLVPPELLQTLGGAGVASETESLDDLDDDERVRAVATLTPYLLSYRSRMASASAPRRTYSGPQTDVVGSAPDVTPACDPAVVVVDTALLQALLLLPDGGALLRFAQRPNNIDLVAGEAALIRAGRYAELICLYQQHNKHDMALDLLKALSTAPESLANTPQGAAAELKGCPGVWHAVKYLTSMEAPDFKLVSAHAKWILQGDPDAGLEMFSQMHPPLSASVVLPILTSYVPRLAGEYLEAALESGAAEREVYEQELAMVYLQQLTLPGSTPAEMPCYERLKQLVLSSELLDHVALLRLLPAQGLLELRVTVLERLERHLEALRICVHQLKDMHLAEAYCDRVYARRVVEHWRPHGAARLAGDSDIYIMFIQVLLEEYDGTGYQVVQRAAEDQRWEEVARVLSRKQQAVLPLQALEILPGEMPLQNCQQFLYSTLYSASEERRQAMLVKNLRRAEHVASLSNLSGARQRAVSVTPERACCMCHKRLGIAAAVAFPDGTLAHFSCYRRLEGKGAF